MSIGPIGLGSSTTGWGKNLNTKIWPDPFMDYASLAMPETIQQALRWCFPPDTPIEMADFSQKAICDVSAGDVVRTRLGTAERVVRTGCREVDEDLVLFQLSGLGKSLPIRLTGNHKLWRAKSPNLKPGRIDPSRLTYECVRADELAPGDFVYSPRPKIAEDTVPAFGGWLFGLYIAEGCVIRSGGRTLRVRFSCGADDEKTGILNRAVREILNSTGQAVEPYEPPSRPDVRTLSVSDVELPDWMERHCSGLASTKSLSGDVLSYGQEFVLDMLGGWLDGWLDGDGWLIRRGQGDTQQITGLGGLTSSLTLARQLQRLAFAAGLRPRLCRQTRASETTFSPAGSQYYVLNFGQEDSLVLASHSEKMRSFVAGGGTISNGRGASNSIRICGDKVYFRVTATGRERYAGQVHTFEVENEHSYLAHGVSVANCEFIFLSNGTYREACRRVVTYFLTDLEIEAENGDNQLRWKDMLETQLDYRNFLNITGLDLSCYGVSFVSVVPVYIRYLGCPKCGGVERPFQKLYDDPQFKFRWSNFAFCADCPMCKYSGPWRVTDRQAGEHAGFRLKRWSPHDIDIVNEPWTGMKQFKWKIPESYRSQVRKGIPHIIANAPLPVIKAIRNGNDLLFDKDFVHYMCEDPLAGVNDEGWGISRVLTNFRQAWYVQVLHRYNEAIALDYVIPFRLLTPAPGDKSVAADAIIGQDGYYMQAVAAMFRRRAADPGAINTLPFPIQFQSLGGDAKALAPDTLLNQGTETLLNNIGIPAELYRGSLTVQAMPAALRLFEASHAALPHNLNALLRFIVRQISTMLRWPTVKVKMSRVSHADDAARAMSRLQLMRSGLVSKTSGLRSVGLDYKQEVRQDMEDQRFQEEEKLKLQTIMDASAQAKQLGQLQQGDPNAAPPGAPGAEAGGAPAGAGQPGADGGAGQSIMAGLPQGPNVKVTPEEQLARATALANRLLGEPEGQKDSDLMQLKNVDPNLHAIVTEQMEDIRRKARMQGGQQVMQQTFGKASSINRLADQALRRLRKLNLEGSDEEFVPSTSRVA